MVTIITGQQGSGKTTKANEITKGKESIWLTNTYYLMLDVLIKKNTEYIIFDGLDLSKYDFTKANIIEL